MNLLVRSISFALLFAILCGGCSKPGPKLVPAKGIITVKGKAAGGIAIQFLPDVKESADGVFPSSQAISKEDGSFELYTMDNQPGAVVGPHKIVLVDSEEERPEQGKAATKPPRIDPGYAVAGKLTATVTEGKLIELVIP